MSFLGEEQQDLNKYETELYYTNNHLTTGACSLPPAAAARFEQNQRGARAADGAVQEKVAGEYVKAVQAMDRKYVGTPEGTVGPTEAATAGGPQPRRGGGPRLRRLWRVQPAG